jgi:MATE family multidrug resistance protein
MQLRNDTRQVLQISAPISLALIIPQLSYMTNTAFLGRLGQFPLAVNGIVAIYYLVMYMASYGLNNGIQVLIARRAGELNYPGIGVFFNQGLWLTLLMAMAGVGVSLSCCGYFFSHALHSPQIYTAAIHFIWIRIWGLPLLMLLGLSNAFYIGTANAKVLIVSSLVQQCTNVLFDYLLIFGKGGFPKLGLFGAAYASVIAEAAGFLCSFIILEWKGYAKRFFLFRGLVPKWPVMREILHISAPLIMQFTFSIGSWLIFFVFVEHLGEEPLAISNILRSVFGFFGVFSWAFSAACNTLVSNLIGQGKESEVTSVMRRICFLSFGCAAVISLSLNLAPVAFLHIFTQDPAMISAARASLVVLSLSTLLSSVSIVVYSGVTGTGHTRVNILIELIAIALYLIYCYWIIQRLRMPLAWAWGSEFLYWTTVLVACMIYMKSGKWKVKVI